MMGHGGDKWRMEACERLATAKNLKATTRDHRMIAFTSGSAVELLLVAIGLKSRNIMYVPAQERGANWHSLVHLARSHGVEVALNQAARDNKALRDNWLIVKDWDSNARFPTASVTGKEALETFNAVAHPDHGVFKWLLNRYDQN